jgi:hypothetical protein
MQQWGAFVQPLRPWKSNKCYVFWVCVCVFSLRYLVTNVHHIVILVLCGCTVFFNIISLTARFSKKKKNIELNMCVLIFSITFIRKLSRSKNSEIWSKLKIGHRVKSDFNETEFLGQILENYYGIKFYENPSSGSRGDRVNNLHIGLVLFFS